MNQKVGLDRMPTGFLRGTRLALTALALLSLAACVGPSASSSVAPSSGSGPTSAASGSPSTTATAANVTAAPTPTPTATPSISPAVPQAPIWTGIHWTAGPASNGLPAPINTTDAAGNTTSTGTQVFGWSDGFVVFRETAVMTADSNSKSIEIVPYVSADGLTWTKGQALDVKGLDAWEVVAGLVEGPAGILAYGHGELATCSGPTHYNSLWLSKDGLSWSRIDTNAYTYIDGGSSGYVATDYSSDIWVSTDGVTWKTVDMATAGTKGILVDGATAFGGGFVVAASVPVPAEGCGTGTSPKTPSLWWSRDGSAWSRDALSPALTGSQASASVRRINDNALLAVGTTWGKVETSRAWTSTDGRVWTIDPDSQVLSNNPLTNGSYGLLVSYPANGKVSVWGFNRALRLVALPQTGDLPTSPLMDGNAPVLGSAGLIVASTDGTRFWLGTPTRS
jgi:hypothetical protein